MSGCEPLNHFRSDTWFHIGCVERIIDSMSSRTVVLATNEIYHIYNRGVAGQPIFTKPKEYRRFKDLLLFYQRQKPIRFSQLSAQARRELIDKGDGQRLVSPICYCLMLNHFHLLLRQDSDRGITDFLRRITDSYSRYFNIINHRYGPLFQGNFKAVRIESNSQLLHATRYIHLNPVTSYLVEQIERYPWSSLHEYIKNQQDVCEKKIILGQFNSPKSYEEFVLDYKDYERSLKVIKHLTLEK